jgi:glycosyltransferase involved in cell wall biosynthesis
MIQEPLAQTKIDCSIIIPNLHSPIIDQTIQSILSQETDRNYEIIVVGMDKFGLVEQFSNNVHFQQTDKPTPPAISRNIGVRLSKGERIFFIDADCIADRDWIEYHFRTQEDFDVPIIVGGGVSFASKPFLTLTDNVSTFHEYMIHNKPGERSLLPSLNLSMPRIIWDALRGFDENFPYASGEDSDFAIRAINHGYKLFFEPKAEIVHRPQRSNLKIIILHAIRFGEFSIKGNREYWDNQFIPFPLRHWLLALLLSPIIALFVILKMVFIEKIPLKFWVTLPFVYLYKICWVIGYAKQIRKRK